MTSARQLVSPVSECILEFALPDDECLTQFYVAYRHSTAYEQPTELAIRNRPSDACVYVL